MKLIDKLYDERKCEFSFNGQRLEYMNRASFKLALAEHKELVIAEYEQIIKKHIYSTHEYLDAWQQERLWRELPKWKDK